MRAVFRTAPHWPRRADQEEMSRNGLWSALQTHLQGVDGTTLAVKPEIILHGVILLSQKLRD
ncbi:hypothetical protein EFQ99_08420 [Rhizobium vallis]|uniref:Uncharacterized protein n=1 Tax=Rhizobium vallis TaxID=634290 RepID=A0A3S0SD73_9HYPH|nr:hypothetical protein EFQ99_08420 [Rhizobium vallis]